jgi:N-acyl-D-aspartate/D-glutamate deacylase
VRDTGLLGVGRAVHALSRRRRVVRLADRGVVAPGYFADVNVVDRQGLGLQAPDMLSGLPLGRTASRDEPAPTATTLVKGRS